MVTVAARSLPAVLTGDQPYLLHLCNSICILAERHKLTKLIDLALFDPRIEKIQAEFICRVRCLASGRGPKKYSRTVQTRSQELR